MRSVYRRTLSARKGMNNTTIAAKPVTDTWTLVQFSLYGLVFVVGVVGNFLVIMTVIRNKAMQSLNNYFIVNLAISDIATLLLNVLLTIMGRYVSWPFGEFCCKYVFSIVDVMSAISALTLVCISFDRYRAIVHPMAFRPTHKQIRITIATIWIVSYVFVSIPLSFGLQLGAGLWTDVACILVWPTPHLKTFFYIERTVIFYILPVLVTLTTYIRITAIIGKNMGFVMRALTPQARIQRLKRQQHLTRVLFTIFIVFAVCLLPIQIFDCLLLAAVDGEAMQILFYVSLLLIVTHSCCNPIILFLMSQEFRNGFRQNLACLAFCSSGAKQSFQGPMATFGAERTNDGFHSQKAAKSTVIAHSFQALDEVSRVNTTAPSNNGTSIPNIQQKTNNRNEISQTSRL